MQALQELVCIGFSLQLCQRLSLLGVIHRFVCKLLWVMSLLVFLVLLQFPLGKLAQCHS